MSTQPEAVLEHTLIQQLGGQGYEIVTLPDEKAVLANLQRQLEKHNGIAFTETEFAKVLNHLGKGSIFERAKTLRDKMQFTRDNGDSAYIEFIDTVNWCKNEFQVTSQVTVAGTYKNRYDVTILINGLPLVQIELKRRGLELKEAFNQVNRYQRHSYGAAQGLFQYVQVFVISNGVNTKYYANNPRQDFKQTFYWAYPDNRIVSQLEEFGRLFLERCHVSKMIAKYTVLNETDKVLMVLRPYQYYAAEAIAERVRTGIRNGYIWHTTGSGKTLTSFKTSQLLLDNPKVQKVVFVVDRRDLDYQTTREFNSFSPDSVDGTRNTRMLVRQFNDGTRLIVTTIQKLNAAISKKAYLSGMAGVKDARIVFIFDECHRSQFGDTHKRIIGYFTNYQLFGFTGTPIFKKNAVAFQGVKKTTRTVFDDCLHKYVITDAIRDENVLKFSIEYVGRYRQREDGRNLIDIEVEDIDRKELLESTQRLGKIVDYVIANHDRKTHRRAFTAMFCVSSIDALIAYYELFKARKQEGAHNLRIATIFTFTDNEEDKDANGEIPDTDMDIGGSAPVNVHSRDKLDEYIADYNELYGCSYSTKDSESFYNYYKDVAKRVRNREVDILLVVNMFLTGFDSKPLNTLYVDKNLKYHGLLQAFSRTNRVLNQQKSQGNIVSFRNLKDATDEAITLFSNKEAIDVILMEPYETYVEKYDAAYAALIELAPTVDSVNDFPSEEEELAFVKAFRELMRLRNILGSFVEFVPEDVAMDEQVFEDYKSKYLDLYEKVRNDTQKEKVSILDDVDFELELIQRDEINVAYILRLLARLKDANPADRDAQRRAISDLLSGDIHLRSKRELIEKFIEENLPTVSNADEVEAEFEGFWQAEQRKAFTALAEQEGLDPTRLESALNDYLFTERMPRRDDVVALLNQKPKLLQRKTVADRVVERIADFVETFFSGMGG